MTGQRPSEFLQLHGGTIDMMLIRGDLNKRKFYHIDMSSPEAEEQLARALEGRDEPEP